MRRKVFHWSALWISLACGGMKDPASVADKFVDKYYVESDQDSALPFTSGVAAMRLKDELKLTAEARRGATEGPLRQVRVYYTRTGLAGDGPSREVDYELDVRPQGGGRLQRLAHLKLAEQPDGTWRVSDFNERQEYERSPPGDFPTRRAPR
jgi:hypothetical protein